MAKTLIVHSQVKKAAVLEKTTFKVSDDFYIRLEQHLKQTIEDACKRALQNKRTTVMGRDV